MNSANSPEGRHKVLIVGGGRAPRRASVRPQSRVMLLKRYGLPALYWQGMLKGRA